MSKTMKAAVVRAFGQPLQIEQVTVWMHPSVPPRREQRDGGYAKIDSRGATDHV